VFHLKVHNAPAHALLSDLLKLLLVRLHHVGQLLCIQVMVLDCDHFCGRRGFDRVLSCLHFIIMSANNSDEPFHEAITVLQNSYKTTHDIHCIANALRKIEFFRGRKSCEFEEIAMAVQYKFVPAS
jgi:endonuclease III